MSDVLVDDAHELDEERELDPLALIDSEEAYLPLKRYTAPVQHNPRPIVGREDEVDSILASLSRVEVPNCLVLGDPGAGKTVLIQAVRDADPQRVYREIEVGRIKSSELPRALAAIFDAAERFVRTEHVEMVLFIDEVHQIVQHSEVAVEIMKPLLAMAGVRGVRVLAATTYDEFHQHISRNLPLMERFQRINLPQPDGATVVEILRGAAQKYEVADQFRDDHVFELIYEYTERYIPASSQPRKSLLVLDAMIGWNRYDDRDMDRILLAEVLERQVGVNVAFTVDAPRIEEHLNSKVLSQAAAVRAVTNRLQLCVADLHDKNRPMASYLFAGSTGVGKLCAPDTPVPVHDPAGGVRWKRHDELEVGDEVFDRQGRPTRVLGVFPQPVQDLYRVTLTDGRSLDVGGPHLWAVYTAKMRANKHAGKEVAPRVMTTQEILEAGVVHNYPHSGREHLKFFLPAGGAVQWPRRELDVDPYVLGVLIGNGCLTLGPLTLSSADQYTVDRVAGWLGCEPKSLPGNFSWVFPNGGRFGSKDRLHQTGEVLSGDAASLVGLRSGDRRIPEAYMTAGIEQRWELVRGLFDTDGHVDATTGRFDLSYSTTSQGLAEDVRQLLFSLGVSNTLDRHVRQRDGKDLVEYDIHCRVDQAEKARFFSLPRKQEVAHRAVAETGWRERVKRFDMLGIRSIEKLPEASAAVCIYVENDEHLYQAGDFVVTHNTELTKQIARLIFGDDQRHLIRFDMSEYALPESMDQFRQEISRAVWDRPYSVVLLDEVEKSDKAVTRLLLQILDDGRISDENGRQVSFLNCIMVLTTNAAATVFNDISRIQREGDIDEQMEQYSKLIRDAVVSNTEGRFPPELLGRLDAMVPFVPLSEGTLEKITLRHLENLVREVSRKHNVTVTVKKTVHDFLVHDLSDSESVSGGARRIASLVNEHVGVTVARFINENPQERHITLAITGNLSSADKNRRRSTARVVAVPTNVRR